MREKTATQCLMPHASSLQEEIEPDGGIVAGQPIDETAQQAERAGAELPAEQGADQHARAEPDR